MATYSTSDHTLEFHDGYKKIRVVDDSATVVATYDLRTTDSSTAVYVANANFVIEAAPDIEFATHKWHVNAGATGSFVGTRMGGIGIIDLRDMGKTNADVTVEYDLGLTVYRLKYITESDKIHLWIQPAVYTVTEN